MTTATRSAVVTEKLSIAPYHVKFSVSYFCTTTQSSLFEKSEVDIKNSRLSTMWQYL